MKNYYPEKPEVKYEKTRVEMGSIVGYIQSLKIPVEIKRTTYIIFRNESGNGSKGLNNNYIGAQADSARWPERWDSHIAGVVIKAENGTGKTRAFLAFNSYKDSIDFLVDRITTRGLFIGGYLTVSANMHIKTPEDLATGYQRSWVKGLRDYKPTEQEISNFISMYRQAEKIFL